MLYAETLQWIALTTPSGAIQLDAVRLLAAFRRLADRVCDCVVEHWESDSLEVAIDLALGLLDASEADVRDIDAWMHEHSDSLPTHPIAVSDEWLASLGDPVAAERLERAYAVLARNMEALKFLADAPQAFVSTPKSSAPPFLSHLVDPRRPPEFALAMLRARQGLVAQTAIESLLFRQLPERSLLLRPLARHVHLGALHQASLLTILPQFRRAPETDPEFPQVDWPAVYSRTARHIQTMERLLQTVSDSEMVAPPYVHLIRWRLHEELRLDDPNLPAEVFLTNRGVDDLDDARTTSIALRHVKSA